MNNITPPVSTLGKPFTKLIKLSLSHLGTIAISSFALKDGAWVQKDAQAGKLTAGKLAIEMGVPEGGRALLTVDAETWIDDWFGSSQQLVGQHPPGQPFVFGQANFAGGAPGVFAAAGLIHTVTKVPGTKAWKVVTQPAVPVAGKKLKPLSDRVTETTMTEKTATVALVLWLETDQTGYARCKSLPGPNRAVAISL